MSNISETQKEIWDFCHGVAGGLNNIANIWISFLCEFSLSNVVDLDDGTFDAYLDLHPRFRTGVQIWIRVPDLTLKKKQKNPDNFGKPYYFRPLQNPH